jgi:hypothetical protein
MRVTIITATIRYLRGNTLYSLSKVNDRGVALQMTICCYISISLYSKVFEAKLWIIGLDETLQRLIVKTF